MKEIVESIKNARCVIFSGAGLSINAGLPNWSGLIKQLYQRLERNGNITKEFGPLITKSLSSNKLMEAVDLLRVGATRADVTKELRAILTSTKESKVHSILKKMDLCGYVTTNYDRLLDDILKSNAYHLTNSLDDLKLVSTAINSPNQFIIKLHGDIDNVFDPKELSVARGAPFMVLSGSDYTALVQGERGDALRSAIHSVLQKANILFLGYSFEDPDISQTMDFLLKYSLFPNKSWYIGLKGERLPKLPGYSQAFCVNSLSTGKLGLTFPIRFDLQLNSIFKEINARSL